MPEFSQRYRLTLIRLALAVYWLTLTVVTHSPGINESNTPRWELIPFDKTMHVLSFAGLAVLLMGARLWRSRRVWVHAAGAVGIGLVYGVVEELTQPWFGRTRSVADLAADGVGLLLGAGAGVVWWRWKRADTPLEEPQGFSGTTLPPGGSATRSGAGEGTRCKNVAQATPAHPHRPAAPSTSPGGGRVADPHRFVGHAVLVGAFTMFSRVTGLARDAALAAVFGASIWLDAFLIGFLVPNLFRRLFGEGALTAAFIPRYSRLLREDPALARRFASLCVVLVAMLLAGVTLLGEAALAVALHYAESEKAGAALTLTMMMLPYMPMVCGVAFLGAILQVHRRFGPPAAAPVLLNLVMIAAGGWMWLGGSEGANPAVMVRVIAWSVLLAGVMQLGWLGWVVARAAPLTVEFAGTRGPFVSMLRTMGPMVIGLGVFQINTLLDGLIAYGLAHPVDDPAATVRLFGRVVAYPIEPGAVTVLTLAQRLYQFPLGVFGIAIATAIFPALAAAYVPREANAPGPRRGPTVTGGADAFSDIVRRGLRLTVFIGLPASVGLILVRVPLTRVFFEHGSFTQADALRTATLVAAYSSAVWAYSMTHVLTRAFYAADDATTPLRVSLAMVGLNLTLNLTLIWALGVAGLAWSTATGAAVQVVLLLWLVRRHVDRPVDAAVLRGWAQVAGLSAVMGGVLWVVAARLDLVTSDGAAVWGQLALLVGVGAGVYLGGAALLRMPEMGWLKRGGNRARPPK